MRNCLKRVAGTLMLVGALLGAPAQASPAVQLTSPGALFDGLGMMLGFEFQVTQQVQVVSLGAFDSGRDGLMSGVWVGLWEEGVVPTELASVQVPSGANTASNGYFRYADIQSLTLLPDHLYVVAAFFEDDQAASLGTGQGGQGGFDARLFNVLDRYGDAGFFEMPIASDGWAGAWLGANFQLQDGRTVPEPATGALLLVALLSAGLAGRRR